MFPTSYLALDTTHIGSIENKMGFDFDLDNKKRIIRFIRQLKDYLSLPRSIGDNQVL